MPANVCLLVTSSTSLTVSFQEPLSVNAAVVTRYKGTALPCLLSLLLPGKDSGAWGWMVRFVCLVPH